MGDAALQFIGYRVVERADLRERHLLSHVISPVLSCWSLCE
jgi:hypothetical protein